MSAIFLDSINIFLRRFDSTKYSLFYMFVLNGKGNDISVFVKKILFMLLTYN